MREIAAMRVKVRVYEAEDGGFWATVPGLPGCITEAETMAELAANVKDAMEGILAEEGEPESDEPSRVLELEL